MSNKILLAIVLGVNIAALGCSSATAPRSSELSRFNAEYVEAKLAYSELRELSKARTHRCEPRGGDTVVYIGRTEDGLTACLEENPTASVLRITSGGGNVREAIPAARIVAARSMSVEVLAQCASSCGNYILPAAASVKVLPFSVVLLHGAPPSDSGKVLRGLEESLRKAGRVSKMDDPEFVQRQLDTHLQTRRLHDDFRQSEGVEEEWYELSFYYRFLDENDLNAGFLIVSADFARKCIGGTTEIADFWEPKSDIERGLADSLVIGPTLLMGTDIPNPSSC